LASRLPATKRFVRLPLLPTGGSPEDARATPPLLLLLPPGSRKNGPASLSGGTLSSVASGGSSGAARGTRDAKTERACAARGKGGAGGNADLFPLEG
jgi:hypothetical protein